MINKIGIIGGTGKMGSSFQKAFEKLSIKFSEKNSKRWALRIIFDNYPELLDTSHYKRMLNHIKDRWLSNDPETPYITIPKALNEMDELGEELELNLFNGYRDYLKDMKENLQKTWMIALIFLA